MKVVEIKDLDFSYGPRKILNGLDFSMEKGENAVIVGDNGSGKSTLLKLILGELKKEAGIIKINDKDIEDTSVYEKVGYVPQLQIIDQIAFPVTCLELVVLNKYRAFGFLKIPDPKSKEKARQVLNQLGLQEYINTPVNRLSGGLKQRTIIARALINEPEILILDEPTVGIDDKSKDHFIELLKDMLDNKDLSVILVTHELDYILEKLDRAKVYKLEGGKLSHVRV